MVKEASPKMQYERELTERLMAELAGTVHKSVGPSRPISKLNLLGDPPKKRDASTDLRSVASSSSNTVNN